ncbi:hypothetical protein HKD37_11G032130 [Glycine soja]
MSALRDQIASMVEAMLGMERLVESNTAAVAAASIAAEVDPVLQPATSPAHHLASDMRGRGRDTKGHANIPHLEYNRGAHPYDLPPNFTPPTMHDSMDDATPATRKGEPPQPTGFAHENP